MLPSMGATYRARSFTAGVLAVAMWAAGCGDGAIGALDGAVTEDLTAAPADLGRHRDLYSPPVPQVSVRGVLLDDDGTPRESTVMSVCSQAGCSYGKSAVDGSFVVQRVALGVFTVHSIDDWTTIPHRGTVARTLLGSHDGEVLEAGEMRTPLMPLGVPLPADPAVPGTILPGDGLALTLRAADLDLPLTAVDQSIAARRIPDQRIPPFDFPGEEVLAVYCVLPWWTTSKSPIGVSATVAAPAGSAVHFRSISGVTGLPSAPAVGVASGDGLSVATSDGQGLGELTWIVISRPLAP